MLTGQIQPAASTAAAVRPPDSPAPAPHAVRTAPEAATAPASAPAATVRPAPDAKPDPRAAPVSTDAKRHWGPLTEGLTPPPRPRPRRPCPRPGPARYQPGAHRLLVSRVNEALPARDAALLVSSHPGPLLAHRMHTMAEAGEPLTTHLARLTPDTAARHTGPPADTATRLPLAAHYALTTPLDTPLPTGPRVSAPAARSTTTRPDTTAHKQRPPPPNLPRRTPPPDRPRTTPRARTVEPPGRSRILERPRQPSLTRDPTRTPERCTA